MERGPVSKEKKEKKCGWSSLAIRNCPNDRIEGSIFCSMHQEIADYEKEIGIAP